MPGSLDPGLAVDLHRCGLEKGDTEVGALGNADAGAQPPLDLALVGRGGTGLSRRQRQADGPPGPLTLTMCMTPVTPTTSNSPSSIRGFSNRESLSEPHRSAPDPQLYQEGGVHS